MSNNPTLCVIAWNIGFGARKTSFTSDSERADEILKIVKDKDVDAVALQEMAYRKYDKDEFNLKDYLENKDEKQNHIHFEISLSLGLQNSYPYGKLPEIKKKFKEIWQVDIEWQKQGPGIWVRNVNNWKLVNLYSNDNKHRAVIEVQRPLPHPLYMGEEPAPKDMEDKKKYSAGRDEEDRPVLWSRIDKDEAKIKNLKIYFVSLHLPTLKNEEKKNHPAGDFTKSQKDIAENVLKLSESRILPNYTIDRLASELRQYYLNHIIFQVKRIEKYWKATSNCVFILAGDFNFYHTTSTNLNKTVEQIILENNGFKRAKLDGTTRPGNRLIDNIWVKGAKTVSEWKEEGKSIEEMTKYVDILEKISDHYPVIAKIGF